MPKETFKARTLEGLVARELGDEVVIYDTDNDRCHVLNAAAAAAWKRCESSATVDDLAEAIASATELPADSEVACLALEELQTAGLLDAASRAPQAREGMSRREMLIGMTGIAAALPIVSSLLAPSPAMAISRDPEPEPKRRPEPEPE